MQAVDHFRLPGADTRAVISAPSTPDHTTTDRQHLQVYGVCWYVLGAEVGEFGSCKVSCGDMRILADNPY